MVVGESYVHRDQFDRLIAAKATPIINPDLFAMGGLRALLEVADGAAQQGLAVTPHDYNSMTVALAANLHAAAVMPNLTVGEYFPQFEPLSARICQSPLLPVDGSLAVPAGAGLGVGMIDSAMEAYRVA